MLALAEEYALVGHISDLYESILRADFKLHRKSEVGVEIWYRGSVRQGGVNVNFILLCWNKAGVA